MYNKVIVLFGFQASYLKNLIKIESTGMTESGGQECNVMIMWEGHKIWKNKSDPLKFGLSEKHTKFEKIFLMLWTCAK